MLIVTASAQRRGAELEATQLAAELHERGVRVVSAALVSAASGLALPAMVLGRRRLGPATLWRLRRAARAADAVIAYGSSTLPACAIALAGSGVPFVYRNISDPAYWVRNRLHQALSGFQYRRAATVVALWRGAAETIVRLFGVAPERVVVIPNARDPDVFRPPTAGERDHARRGLGLDERPAIGFLGRLSPEKRIDVAIAAIAALPEHVLVVAGRGPIRGDAERQAAAEAPGRVIFLGEVADVTTVIHAVDAVVIPSEAEGMPGVGIEAALCGVPVVATPVGALPEMPFVTIAERDPAILAKALADAVAPRRESVEPFTWPVVVARWMEHLGGVARS